MELVELITIRQDPSRLRLVLIISTAVHAHTAGTKKKKQNNPTGSLCCFCVLICVWVWVCISGSEQRSYLKLLTFKCSISIKLAVLNVLVILNINKYVDYKYCMLVQII